MARIIRPTPTEWIVIERFLGLAAEEGAIVIPPGADEFLVLEGVNVDDGESIPYAFGGEPDILIDVLRGEDSFCADALREHAWAPEEDE